MRKPWETEELSEDWVPDACSGSDKSTSSVHVENSEGTKSRRQGYGTVKISATGSKLTLSSHTTRTLQNGGTLIINDALAAGTVKAPPPWHNGTDLFSPLSLETMFNQPNSFKPFGKSSIKNCGIVGAPLRRVSGRPTVRFRSKPSSQASSINVSMPFNRQDSSSPSMPNFKSFPKVKSTLPEKTCLDNESLRVEDDCGHQLKRTQSDSGGRTHPTKLNHSLLFQLQYDTTTRNCLSALVSQIDSSQENIHSETSSVRSVRSIDSSVNLKPSEKTARGSIRKMPSAPSLHNLRDTSPLHRQSSYRMLTPHPPTWQWLQAQTETDYDPVDLPPISPSSQTSSADCSLEESLSDSETLDHEWLRQISITTPCVADASYLSNIDFLDDLSVSRDINQSMTRSSHEPSFSSSQATSSTERQSDKKTTGINSVLSPSASSNFKECNIETKYDTIEKPLQPLESSTLNAFPNSNYNKIIQESIDIKSENSIVKQSANENSISPEKHNLEVNQENLRIESTEQIQIVTTQDKKNKLYSQSMSALYHEPSRALPPNLWNELFQPSPHSRVHLGPDRAADQLKKCGVLPHRVLSGELILIRPSQVGNVPHQVNNMRFNPAHMRWEPISDEDDPFAGVTTLKLRPEELASLSKQVQEPNSQHQSNFTPKPRPVWADLGPPGTSSMSRVRSIIKTRTASLASQLPLRSTSSLDRNFSPKSNNSLPRYKPASENLFIPPLLDKKEDISCGDNANGDIKVDKKSSVLSNEIIEPISIKQTFTSKNLNPIAHDGALHGWFIPTSPPKSKEMKASQSNSIPRCYVSKSTQTQNKENFGSSGDLYFSKKYQPYDSIGQIFPPEKPHQNHKSTSFNNQDRILKERSEFQPSPGALHRLFALYNHPFRALKYLTLVGVELKTLKEFSLPNLSTLDVRQNRLVRIDICAPRLKKLILASNWISDYQEIYHRCPELEKLDLSYNRVTNIPIFIISKLQWISLAYNRLTVVSGKFPYIKSLNLSGNSIVEWNACLPSLHTLYLDRLPIPCKFISRVINLPSIVRLGLRFTVIPNVQTTFSPTLKYLYTQGCEGIPSLLGVWAQQKIISNLVYLELSDLKLTIFPWDIIEATNNLVALDLSRNRLERLSLPISTCSSNQTSQRGVSLKWLNLSSNFLHVMTDINDFFIHLPNIQALDMRNNLFRVGMNHSDDNIVTMYKTGLQATLPHLIKLDGRRIR